MSTGETMITLGALTLLVVIILNMNRNLNTTDAFLNETRYGLEKVAIATSFIEEISQYAFDEASWDTTDVEKVPSDFTLPIDMGPESGETDGSLFDDVDDFHNYSLAETTMQNIYNIHCQVNYVEAASPAVVHSNRTYYKRIRVSISSIMTADTTTMDYIHGFWYFN